MTRWNERIRVVQPWLFALVALLPTEAHAELLPAERTSVRSAIDASNFVATAEREVTVAVNTAGTTEASRAALGHAMRQLIGVSREITLGTAILVGTNPVQFADVAGVRAWEAMTRADQVARAFFYLGRINMLIDGAQSALQAARAHKTTNSVYQTALRQAQVVWLGEARKSINAVDRTLGYADPMPALCAGCTIHPVVGPHGDYAKAQKWLYFATKYWRDFAEDWVESYVGGGVLRDYQFYAGAFRHYTHGVDAQHRAMGLLAGVTWTAAEAGEDAFCRTLRAMKLLTDGDAFESSPFQYHYVQSYWRSAWDTESSAYRNSLTRFSDSWKHNDSAVWELMVFANSTRCPNS
jgi:hypothetical protein